MMDIHDSMIFSESYWNPVWILRLTVRRIRRYCYNPYHSILRGLILTLKGCRYKTDDCRFVLPRKLLGLSFRAQFHSNVYEERERTLVRQFVRPDDRVLELGACLGVVACVTEGQLANNDATHVVVEANPNLLPWIFKNRRLNNAGFVVEFCAIAEGACATFSLNDRIDRGSLQQEGDDTIFVPCRTVQELEQKDGAFNTLVMDIQGAEIGVLKTLEGLLSHYRLLIIEWHESITGAQPIEDCKAILKRCGFTVSRRIGPVEAWERMASSKCEKQTLDSDRT